MIVQLCLACRSDSKGAEPTSAKAEAEAGREGNHTIRYWVDGAESESSCGNQAKKVGKVPDGVFILRRNWLLVALSDEAQAIAWRPNRAYWFGFASHANKTFHPFELGELISDLPKKDKTLTYHRHATEGHSLGQKRLQIASKISCRARMHGSS